MDGYRDPSQELAARDAEKMRREAGQQHAVPSTAESLQEVAQLLEALVDEVRGIRQDVATIKASMSQDRP